MANLTEPVPTPQLYTGTGSPGVRRSMGYIQEEFLRELFGTRGPRAYREMSDNDPLVGGFLTLVGGLFRTMDWQVEPIDPENADDVAAKEFLEQEVNNLRPSIREQMSCAVDMFPFGFSLSELVYKRRPDGKVGWDEWRWLAPETIERWIFDEDTDKTVAFVQRPPPHYDERYISLQRCLHLRTTRRKGNPEGKSMLRNAWRSWFMKTKLEEIEAIGAERDLAGLPVMRIPIKYMGADIDPKDAAVFENAKKLVRNVRRDEHEGLVLPSDYDNDGKNRLIEFELLSSGGTRAIDISRIIERYDGRMAMAVLADFLLLGHQKVGTFSLSNDKTSLFGVAFGGFADVMAEELTTQVADQLMYLNVMKGRAKFVHGDFEKTDVAMFTTALANLAKAGIIVPGEPNLEAYTRELLNLPEPDELWVQEQQQKEEDQMAALREAAASPPSNPTGGTNANRQNKPPAAGVPDGTGPGATGA